MPLEAEGREMDSSAENLCFRKNTNTTYSIQFHFHVGITVWIAKVGKVRSPGSVLGVTFHDDRVLVECLRKG